MSKKPVLTVADAIRLLQAMPQDLEVHSDGCDCVDVARDIELVPPRGDFPAYVVVCRD